MGGILTIDVLIAEDEPGILESLNFILKRAGWSVRSVTDGEAALEMGGVLKPCVMVLAVMLPKLSGVEVLKQLRANEAPRDMPVLILTAKGQTQDKVQANELGARAFVTKPYANADVVDIVGQLLSMAKLKKRQDGQGRF